MKLNFGLQPYWNDIAKQYKLEYSKELDKITSCNIIDYEYIKSFINSCFVQNIKLSVICYTSQTIPSMLDFDSMLLAAGSKIEDIIYISGGNYKFSTGKVENVKYFWSINKHNDRNIAEMLNRFNKLQCFS